MRAPKHASHACIPCVHPMHASHACIPCVHPMRASHACIPLPLLAAGPGAAHRQARERRISGMGRGAQGERLVQVCARSADVGGAQPREGRRHRPDAPGVRRAAGHVRKGHDDAAH
eukprot:364227-Chlamydomonas_euryale.AAC.5